MGKCLSSSSVMVVDVSRSISETSKIIKNKLRIHNYTQINDESEEVNTNQIPYKYEDGDNDVIPNISDKNEIDEIDEIFEDELNNKI